MDLKSAQYHCLHAVTGVMPSDACSTLWFEGMGETVDNNKRKSHDSQNECYRKFMTIVLHNILSLTEHDNIPLCKNKSRT